MAFRCVVLGSVPSLPAINATVFRRGGFLIPLHRHGSHVRNVGGHGAKAFVVVDEAIRARASSQRRG